MSRTLAATLRGSVGMFLAVGWLMVAPSVGWGAEPPPVRPRPPRPMPPMPPPMPGYGDELPADPETPPEQLPPSYYASLGQVYLQYKQWSKAEEAFQQAYEKEKDAARRVEAAYNLARLYMRKKEYDKALPLMKEAAEYKPEAGRGYASSRYKRSLIALLEKLDKKEEVVAIYRDMLAAATTSYERDFARREFYRYCKRAGSLEAEIRKLDAAVEKNSKDKEALEGLQMIYSYIEPNPEKSLVVSERLFVADPKDRTAATRLASAYQRVNNYDKAAEVLETFIAENPEEAKFLQSQLTHLYIAGGKKDKAIEWAKKLVAEDPRNLHSRAQAAQLYERLNMIDEALAEYEAAADLATRDFERERYMLSAAHAARRAKKYDTAEKLARTLVESKSKATVAQAKRLLFEIYEEQNKLDQLDIRPQKR